MTDIDPLINELWQLAATLLVLSMQAGFLLLEAGSVRAKNSVNVAQKNLTDLVICWVFFLLFGYTLAFGIPSPLWTGTHATGTTQFLFQLGFCGAAATIIAGAVAERMTFAAYAVLSASVVAIIYPTAVALTWGNLMLPDRSAFLADLGFVDFAGGSVVHALAAAVSLAAVIQLGPRVGRFKEDGKARSIPGHSPVLAMLGTLILLIGWFGFNAGGLSPSDPRFAQTVLNTAVAACFGALPALLIGRRLDNGIFNPERTLCGLLAGLVCVTAGAGFATTGEAALIGALGGSAAVLASDHLLHRMRLDDPLHVVAVHGVPGVLGTLAVALLLPTDLLVGGSRWSQFGVQAAGAATIIGFAFTTGWLSLAAIARFTPLRVTAEDEHLGLNYTEHGVSIDTQRLKRALDTQLANGSFESGLSLTPDIYDEAGEVAESLNALLERNDKAHATIRQQAKRFQQFAHTTTDYLWETDVELRISLLTQNASGDTHESSASHNGAFLFDVFTCPEDNLAENIARIRQHQPLIPFQATMHPAAHDAEARIIDVTGVPFFDDNGILIGYRGGATDITDRQKAERRAHYLAYHDELTGLGNRRALNDTLSARLSDGKENAPLIVAGIDLDGFKEVNDAYGHAIGDKLLKLIATRLTEALRDSDKVYRTGGDEFIAVLDGFDRDHSRDQAATWCTRIIERLNEPAKLEQHTVSVGASIGISVFPDDSSQQDDLVRMADIAMYQAKLNGKGRVVPFKPSMDQDANDRRELESSLHQAFQRREFFMVYQPKMSLKSHKIKGFEALVRWRHPERGVLLPADFLPAVERLNLVAELGNYVLHEACDFAASFEETHLHIAVNISPLHLAHPNFLAELDHIMQATGVAPAVLEIEVTEEALIRDLAQTLAVLGAIRERGISIAVDDFGCGNTSLRYLQQFPLDKLKIDRSFIQNIGTSKKAREIARSVVRLGHDLGLSVVAEGVEEHAQLTELSDWECDEAQGFYFSRPVGGTAARELIADEQHSAPSGSAPAQGTAARS